MAFRNDDDVPDAIRGAYRRACEALGPLDETAFAWAFGLDERTLAELRSRIEEQLAHDRVLAAEQLANYLHDHLSAEAFARWVDSYLDADRIVERALGGDDPRITQARKR